MNINFGKNAYQAQSKFLNSQRCINFYLEPAPEDSKEPWALYGTPGLTLFADLGANPIYGMHVMGDYLYAVSGDNVHRVDSGSGSNNLGSIGTTTDNVIMADNGVHVVLTKEGGAAYIANSSSLAQITDGDFDSASSVTVLDGFGIFSRLGTNQFAISALLDLSDYDALDFATAEASGGLIVRVFAHKGNLWIFKTDITEIYYNSGGGDFPFVPLPNAQINRGCAAKRSVAEGDNTLLFLGDDKIIYRMNGYTPKRISTFAIEAAIEGYTTISDAEAFTYTQAGHAFYVITFPTELETWVYDMATGLWHQRQSFEKGRWRATSYVKFNDKHLVGDFESGKIYELDLDTYTENGDTIQRIVTSPPLNKENKRITYDRLWIGFDPGVGLTSGQGSNPQAILRYSDTAGNTWSNEKWRSMGLKGKYKHQIHWTGLGQSRHRIYELTITDPIPCRISGAYANLRIGKA
jgi:hypothetical protein